MWCVYIAMGVTPIAGWLIYIDVDCEHRNTLWQSNIAMENHHVQWENSLFRLGDGFKSYVNVYPRVKLI